MVVAEFLAALDIKKATVCGLSMGGYIALALARKHADKLAGIDPRRHARRRGRFDDESEPHEGDRDRDREGHRGAGCSRECCRRC